MNSENINILVVDDEEIVRESLTSWFREDGYRVESASDAKEALKMMSNEQWDIFFLDIKMPGMDGMELHRRIREIDPDAMVIMITAYAAVDTAVQALKEGAFDYITKPFDPDNLSHIVRNACKQRELIKENVKLKKNIQQLQTIPEIIGKGRHISEIKNLIRTVAPTSTTVMIRGESGTGKELVAQAIHALSERKYAPLVSVNCGAFSESLLESELFGHEKGAFTGAQYRRKGKLEIADSGTLFLDEVGTIDMKTQIDLLRAIDTHKFSRLGSNEIIHSDFRIIAATNTDLEAFVRQGIFREDLYYRLQVYSIELKPLRERTEDIPELVQYFIRKFSREMNKKVTGIVPQALEELIHYPWVGNVRELANAIERAMVMSKSSKLVFGDFQLSTTDIPLAQNTDTSMNLESVEKEHIFRVLNHSKWNISAAANILAIDRATIYKKMKKYGIKRPTNA